jgi:hypothetical protein
MADLTAPDRAWVVAGLTLANLTAKDIAERLHCSLRLVRSIRAEPITQMAVVMQTESRNFADELRLERSEHQVTRQQLAETQAERDRLKRQLDNLLDAQSEHGMTRRELAEARAREARIQRKLDQIVDKLAVGERVRTCYRNHPLIGDNVYRHGNRVYCRECNRENTIAYRKRNRAEQQRHSAVCRTAVHAAPVASA